MVTHYHNAAVAQTKRSDSSIALLTAAMPRLAALYNRRKWQLIGKSQWCCSANCGHPLHALTYNWTSGMQLANTPPLQSTTPGLNPVSFHQMAPPVLGNTHPITTYYSVYRPWKDERLSRPVLAWLLTNISTIQHPFYCFQSIDTIGCVSGRVSVL